MNHTVEFPIGPAIRAVRKARGIKLIDFADMAGLDKSTICKFEQGHHGMSITNLTTMAAALDLPLSTLFAEAERHAMNNAQFFSCSVSQVPLLSAAQTLQFARTGNMKNINIEAAVSVAAPVRAGSFAYEISGDAMLPEVPNGARVVVEPAIEPNHGSYVLAYIADRAGGHDFITFRRMIEEGGQRFLKASNEKYPLIEWKQGDRILGVVSQVTTRLAH